jgi:hypothetical protein
VAEVRKKWAHQISRIDSLGCRDEARRGVQQRALALSVRDGVARKVKLSLRASQAIDEMLDERRSLRRRQVSRSPRGETFFAPLLTRWWDAHAGARNA